MIEELEKRSKVSEYIRHLKSLYPENVHWVKFEGFSMANWEISTKATIESTFNPDKIAYEKTRDFIKNYRTDTWALLELKFINLIEWYDTMKFDVNFKIK
jgi:hypothetical protein